MGCCMSVEQQSLVAHSNHSGYYIAKHFIAKSKQSFVDLYFAIRSSETAIASWAP